jgi:hypothetical protein
MSQVRKTCGSESALLVLPIATFAFGDPFDRLVHPALARCVGLGLLEPIDVLTLETGAGGVEFFQPGFHCLQRREKIIGHVQRARGGGLGARRSDDALLVQLHGLLDVASQFLFRRQVLDRSKAAEIAHRFALVHPGEQQRALPAAESAVGFECRHPAQQALVLEVRAAPFHRLLHVRTRRMDHLAQMREDRLREVGSLGEIGVNTGIDDWHGWIVSR